MITRVSISSIVLAALLVVSGCTSMTGQTAGQYVDDSTITASVKAKLVGDKTVNLTRIEVDTTNQVVTLNGIVESADQRAKAEQLARQVGGVKGVKNNPRKEITMLRNDEFSTFPYLLIGIGIGMVAGLLLAPRSGEEMREDIRRRTHEGVDYLNQQGEKLRDGAEKVVSKGKEWIGRQSESIQSAAETRKPSHEQI